MAGLREPLARRGLRRQDVAVHDGDLGVSVQGGGGQHAGQSRADDDGSGEAVPRLPGAAPRGTLAGSLMEVAL
ncbi:hypothetical protein SAV31267_079120 [Streptomyces avermitilis]|uniref:Uncharacterized protein n=1 Tax=Streptomyces avermitilis TaxID=33903 RepID=A0A4D4N5D9_STRAX|nr:hypothetical protein SAV31267_079120 [Streptomyces avermitilis]